MTGAYHVPMRQVPDGALSPTPHYYEIRGRAAEIARVLGSPAGGAEHLFLAMLHDGGWPVSSDPAVTGGVLNTALASLNRPTLSS